MTDAAHPLLDVLVALFCRPGGAGEGGEELARVHIGWELRSGQWVAIGGPDGSLLAWASWWLTDDAGLQRLRVESFADIVHSGDPIPLTHGPRAYVATATVVPGASPAIYRKLYRAVEKAVAEVGARTIAGHLVKRDGRRCWHERSLK